MEDTVDALRSFIDGNEDLERLETILDRFNLFESLGLVRQEIRHSSFIRWILDPSETHGLGDYWLRQFLRRAIKNAEGSPNNAPSLFDLDDWDLGRAEIRKEWHHIDLLIFDERNQFACVVENKVDSGESAGQLQRYRETVEREFAQYKRMYVFLTISGQAPSDKEYVAMSYGHLASVIESALRRRESQVNDEIKLFLQHYVDMVRRHVVEESEIQELCRRLYRNHRRALDLIFEHRLDRTAEVSKTIQDYIRSRDDLILIDDSKVYIRFLPQCMDVPELGKIVPWGIDIKDKRVRFKLELRPGPQELREQIYEKAKSLPETFGKPKSRMSPQFHTFFSETWISGKEYDELDDEAIAERVRQRIDSLLERRGKAMSNALKELVCSSALS